MYTPVLLLIVKHLYLNEHSVGAWEPGRSIPPNLPISKSAVSLRQGLKFFLSRKVIEDLM